MNCFYKKNREAGKNNGGYATMGEIIDTLVITKDGVTIELTGEEAMTLYNLIKCPYAPKA
jgi:hypothetical protein